MVYHDKMLEDFSYRLTLLNLEVNSWKSQKNTWIPDAKEVHLVVQADQKPGLVHEEGVVVSGLRLQSKLLSRWEGERPKTSQLLFQLA